MGEPLLQATAALPGAHGAVSIGRNGGHTSPGACGDGGR